MRVTREQRDGDRLTRLAEAVVGFRMIQQRFSTWVISDSSARTIETRLHDGPFRRLHNQWRFDPDGAGGARVTFEIEYEFSHPILRALASSVGEEAGRRIMAAFADEADRRYGAVTSSVAEAQDR
jgi:coenzyme Q-binding protein COQ10